MEAEEFGSGSGNGTEGRRGRWVGWFPSLEAGRLMHRPVSADSDVSR